MLLAREKKIVTLLIEHEDKLTTTQIATSLKVSSRTIKADIKKINEELEKHSCRINSQQGVGLWIEYDNHEAKKLSERSHKGYSRFVSVSGGQKVSSGCRASLTG